MLRQINSLLLIPVFFLLIVHIIFMSGLLAGLTGFMEIFTYAGKALTVLILIHAIIGCILMIERLVKKRLGHTYPTKNKGYLVQAITGILMVFLVFVHMTAYGYIAPDGSFILRTPTLAYGISECLLGIIVFLHCVVSLPKLFISLGLVKEKIDMMRVRAVTVITTIVFLALILTAFAIYYLPPILGGLS